MLLLFGIGILLIYASLNISSQIENGCDASSLLKNCNRGVLITGVTLVVSSLAFGGCRFSYGHHGYSTGRSARGTRTITYDTHAEYLSFTIYYSFIFALGITLTTLGAFIHREAAKGTDAACKKAQDLAPLIWGSGTTMISICILYYLLPFFTRQAGKHYLQHTRRGRALAQAPGGRARVVPAATARVAAPSTARVAAAPFRGAGTAGAERRWGAGGVHSKGGQGGQRGIEMSTFGRGAAGGHGGIFSSFPSPKGRMPDGPRTPDGSACPQGTFSRKKPIGHLPQTKGDGTKGRKSSKM